MIGMYQFGCADAGAVVAAAACDAGAEVGVATCDAGAEVGVAEPLQAPTSTATAATLNNRLIAIWFPASSFVGCLSGPVVGPAIRTEVGRVPSRLASSATDDVEIDGEDDDHAGRDDLPLLWHVHEL